MRNNGIIVKELEIILENKKDKRKK